MTILDTLSSTITRLRQVKTSEEYEKEEEEEEEEKKRRRKWKRRRRKIDTRMKRVDRLLK